MEKSDRLETRLFRTTIKSLQNLKPFMQLSIFLGLLTLLTPLFGYSQVVQDTSYFSKKIKKVEAKVLSNRSVGIADTNAAQIKGQVFNDENKGVQCEITILSLKSKKKLTIQTDEDGKFNYYVSPEICSLAFKQSGHGELTIETLKLTPGQINEINVSLGSRFIVQEWIRIPGDTLRIRQKRKLR